jgi:ribonuclease T1
MSFGSLFTRPFVRLFTRLAQLSGHVVVPAVCVAVVGIGLPSVAGARTLAGGVAMGATVGAVVDGQIALEALPKQGQAVYAQIHQGGSFSFSQDGSVFGNYERLLPRQPHGYYREYTVTYNAASRSRGPRRIVCGGQQPSQPDACYYSPDHYKSFLRIAPPALRPSERLQQRSAAPKVR